MPAPKEKEQKTILLSSSISTLYPHHPPGTTVLLRESEYGLTFDDRIQVIGSALLIIGSVVWVPTAYYLAWRKWCQIREEIAQVDSELLLYEYQENNTSNSRTNNRTGYLDTRQPNNINHQSQQKRLEVLMQQKKYLRRKATVFGATVLTVTFLFVSKYSPHRTKLFQRWVQIKKWKFISSWVKFVAMEILSDQKQSQYPNGHLAPTIGSPEFHNEQSVLAFVPHGIFPFGFGFGFISYTAEQIFGYFRPVAATATSLVPFLRDIILWCSKIDASTNEVDTALKNGDRIGINPGGIDEIFLSYPKPGTNPNTEYCIVRKGFLRLAAKYNLPVYPIYCFGATKMFRRVELPFLEQLSHYLRISLVLFYGVLGLPIPFRQKLMYVIGTPIIPPALNGAFSDSSDATVALMHNQFCDELQRIFERHKSSYGWDHKSLEIISK
jgi:Diacylglycerol acyltransferase